MYNHTGLQGRLTADPELRYTQQGTAITSFTLASDTGRKTKDGKKITNFIECVAWRAQAEFVCKYLSKGRLVLVEGELTSRSYLITYAGKSLGEKISRNRHGLDADGNPLPDPSGDTLNNEEAQG